MEALLDLPKAYEIFQSHGLEPKLIDADKTGTIAHDNKILLGNTIKQKSFLSNIALKQESLNQQRIDNLQLKQSNPLGETLSQKETRFDNAQS